LSSKPTLSHPYALRFVIPIKETDTLIASTSSSTNAALSLRKIRLDPLAQKQEITSPTPRPLAGQLCQCPTCQSGKPGPQSS
jgi:hypothetical protein